jgi:CelD/BcsL family acetyltransferase involved in cellulose biosynthesis
MLTTRLITTGEELAALEAPWNALADGEPLRSWDWLATWWKHYGQQGERELHVMAVYDGETLVGIAPWYVERSITKGQAIRFLGDGHVCTDHVSLLCRPENIERVATAIAEQVATSSDWDRVELEAVDDDDAAIASLMQKLQDHECLVSRQPVSNCWVLDLPASWDEYLHLISQSHRRHLKKCQRDAVDSGRAKLHVVKHREELEQAWSVLVDLHQRRRQSLGEPGCFASAAFHGFHRELIERLFAKGQLRLAWVEFDGTPFAAEYHLAGRDTVYTYQSGMDTDRLHDAPGRVAYLLTLQRALAEGFKHFDFMRGDEPYKAHFRGVAKPQFDYRVFPNRRLARWRGQIELAGKSLKLWVKQGVASVMN